MNNIGHSSANDTKSPDNHSPQNSNGGQTISVNVGSSKNLLQEKVLASSETSAYGLQATSERGDYKTGSNMETTGDVRLNGSEVVSLLKPETPRSSKSSADIPICAYCNKPIISHNTCRCSCLDIKDKTKGEEKMKESRLLLNCIVKLEGVLVR